MGVRVVRSFTGEAIEQEKFGQGNEDFLSIKAKVYRFMGQFQSANRFFEGFLYIVVVVAGALFMIGGRIAAGDLVAYLLYVTTLLNSIRKIVDFAEQFQRGMTGVSGFLRFWTRRPTSPTMRTPAPIGDINGEIEFHAVDFSYNDGEKRVLSGVNLKVHAGEKLALVGPSGGGKTTLCSLIPRFYDISGAESASTG